MIFIDGEFCIYFIYIKFINFCFLLLAIKVEVYIMAKKKTAKKAAKKPAKKKKK